MAKIFSKASKIALLSATAFTLAACGGGSKQQKYDDEGRERISILTGAQGIAVDTTISTLPVVLPPPYRNKNWAQAGGNAQHVTQHLELGDNLSKAWTAKIGRGNEKYERLVGGPVAGNGLVFAVDIKSNVTAVSLANGSTAWTTDLSTNE